MMLHMERLELRQMRYFTIVAETLHFGIASKQVGLAQSDLIYQIREIEKAIGCPLFFRNSDEVYLTLTPAGSYLINRLKDLQINFEDIVQATRLIGDGKTVHLTIGFSGSAMYTRLPLALDRFRRSCAGAEIDLKEVSVHEYTSLLLEGKLDAGFVRDGPETYGLRMTPVSREPFKLLLPQSHTLAGKHSPLEPDDLGNENFIFCSPRSSWLTFERTMNIFRSTDFSPKISREAPDWITAASLVGSGMGVCLAPTSIAQLNLPGVVSHPIHSEERSFVDLWTVSAVRNPSIAQLITVIEEEFSSALGTMA